MVEFAFIVPILVMIIFGIVVFGLALNVKQDLTRAAAEGARTGAVALPNQDRSVIAYNATDDAVRGFLNGGCTGNVDVVCSVEGPAATLCDNGQGQCIKVTVTYSGNLAGRTVPFVGQVIPDTLVSSSVARVND